MCLSMFNHRAVELEVSRPVLVIGNGVHLSSAEEECRRLVRHMGIPVVSSWTAADIVPTDDPLYIGRFGLFGDRAANFAVQNADFLLVIGCRLSIPQIGHRCELFAREAKIAMVDVDQAELDKPTLRIWQKVNEDAKSFIQRALTEPMDEEGGVQPWVKCCQHWKARYTMEFEPRSEGIDSFRFIAELSEALDDKAVVVTDMGTSFTCTFQAAQTKLGQRWLTASGHAPMGYGLPGAIGAYYATGRRVVCITGDGGLMLNLQELAQVAGAMLPITIFVLNNGGYLTMKHTQKNHFGRLTGADESSGLHMPDWKEVAEAFGLKWDFYMGNPSPSLLYRGPVLCEVQLEPNQQLIPRVQTTKDADGTLHGGLLEDMWPYLPREEFKMNMIGADPA